MTMADDRFPSRPGSRRPSRFGPTAIIREFIPSEDAQLLPLFAQRVETEERRQSPRFPAAEQRTWLGWWTITQMFATVATRLDDISQGGARLVMADPPAAGQIVWLCLGIPGPIECVQAKVIAVTPGSGPGPEADSIVPDRVRYSLPAESLSDGDRRRLGPEDERRLMRGRPLWRSEPYRKMEGSPYRERFRPNRRAFSQR